MNKELEKKETHLPETRERTRERQAFLPATDIIETRDQFILYSDMPGVDNNSIDITLDKNVLTIHGTVSEEHPKDHTLSYSEYSTGDYERVFTLPEEIDRNQIDAIVKNGTLRLTLPKSPEAKAQKISVRSE